MEFILGGLLLLVALREWQHRGELREAAEERQKVLDFAEGISERAAESNRSQVTSHDLLVEKMNKQLSDMATRVQAPKEAPFILNMDGEDPPAPPADEDAAYWERVNGGS